MFNDFAKCSIIKYYTNLTIYASKWPWHLSISFFFYLEFFVNKYEACFLYCSKAKLIKFQTNATVDRHKNTMAQNFDNAGWLIITCKCYRFMYFWIFKHNVWFMTKKIHVVLNYFTSTGIPSALSVLGVVSPCLSASLACFWAAFHNALFTNLLDAALSIFGALAESCMFLARSM